MQLDSTDRSILKILYEQKREKEREKEIARKKKMKRAHELQNYLIQACVN